MHIIVENRRSRSLTPALAVYTWRMDRRASELERQRAREVAGEVLDGRTTVLEAVRELVYLEHTDAISNEDDRKLIIGIESETDHLPVGEVRKLWAASALQEKDAEIASAKAFWKTEFLEACERIVRA
jgi:hypothetical protein